MSISFSEDAQQEVVTSSRVLPEDSGEGSLRPRLLKDYTGQEKAKENLQVCIDAARLRGEPLDHVLLYGPPGLGKTTMAAVIANEMGVNMRITSGPAIEKAGDLAALLTNLQENDIYLWTRSTDSTVRSRRSFTLPWRTMRSISSSARARQPIRSGWICRASRSSARPRAPVS